MSSTLSSVWAARLVRVSASCPWRATLLSSLALLFSTFAGHASFAQEADGSPRSWVQVKGSDTIGEHLGQALIQAYSTADGEIRWESLGSSTGFVGLFDGSADIAAASRSIRPAEVARAESLDLKLQEYVIGYDGIAVIVHRGNPVRALSMQQLARIFRGDVRRWSSLGGQDLPIHLLSRPSYSGTHGFFLDSVVRTRPFDENADFAADTRFVEETDEILLEVSRDPSAISYVGLGFLAERPGQVQALALSDGDRRSPVLPNLESVRAGTYPIYRPLYLYASQRLPSRARDFLSFILSSRGQAQVASFGFIPLDVEGQVDVATSADPTDVAAAPTSRRPVRIYFAFASTELDADARATLEELARRARETTDHIEVTGHTDSIGNREVNRFVSARRASAAAGYLEILGVPRERIELRARGFDEPVATNTKVDGRSRNRRVDLRFIRTPTD